MPSSAVKRTLPPSEAEKKEGSLAPPALMSLSKFVPLLVPSVTHSSLPFTPSSAVNNNLSSIIPKTHGLLPPVELMSLIITVPNSVPSVFHHSEPFTPSFAIKISVPWCKWFRVVENRWNRVGHGYDQ